MRRSLQNNHKRKLEILPYNNSGQHCTNRPKSNLHFKSHRAPINAFKLITVRANDDAIAVSNGICDAAHICGPRQNKIHLECPAPNKSAANPNTAAQSPLNDRVWPITTSINLRRWYSSISKTARVRQYWIPVSTLTLVLYLEKPPLTLAR
jgi:hypothetical protein